VKYHINKENVQYLSTKAIPFVSSYIWTHVVLKNTISIVKRGLFSKEFAFNPEDARRYRTFDHN